MSSVDPLMSAKRTVTCLRSPSTAPRAARILRARCGGVYAAGALARAAVAATGFGSGEPHSVQKRLPARLPWPQRGQGTAKLAPHVAQKRASAGFSASQVAQRIGRNSWTVRANPRPEYRAGAFRVQRAGVSG